MKINKQIIIDGQVQAITTDMTPEEEEVYQTMQAEVTPIDPLERLNELEAELVRLKAQLGQG